MFNTADDAYDRFMGRYSSKLGPKFADFAGIGSGQRVLDCGAGTGALTSELVERVGPEAVVAAEPSPRFVDALRRKFPDVDVHLAPAEELPLPNGELDAALAQLVISFVTDAPKAVAELKRVVRGGGTVAICMWDLGGGMEMLAAIARARTVVDPTPGGHEVLTNWQPEAMIELLAGAGLREVSVATLEVESDYSGFDELWAALSGGVGPAGAWFLTLDEVGREKLRDELYREVGSPAGPFTLHARCNAARGTV